MTKAGVNCGCWPPLRQTVRDEGGPMPTTAPMDELSARTNRADPPMTLYGVDLSNNNWRVPAANIVPTLNEIIAEGFSWIEHKVSEGNYYTDP